MAMSTSQLGQTCPQDQIYNPKPQKIGEILTTIPR